AKRGELEIALTDLRKAYELKPGDSMIQGELNRFLMSAGKEQTESARTIFDETLKLDPLAPLNWAQGPWRHFVAGRLPEALADARRMLGLTDVGNPARVYAGYYFMLMNVHDEADRIFEEEGAALGNTPYGSISLFLRSAMKQDSEGAVAKITPH